MGTKLIIWSQGEFCPKLGKKIVQLDHKVYPGPSDKLVKIDGFNISPDKNGNYIKKYSGKLFSEDELDAIHTYATIRMVVNLFEDLFCKPIHWSWWKDGKGDPLLIKIRSNDINARFIKDQKCIELDNYGPQDNQIHNCRSVDLVAHETGHAILDAVMPHLNVGNSESKGIGEAFCDLAAMFMVLSQYDLCDYVIEETRGNLRQSNILSLFGVGHGDDENQFREIRNALNNYTYKSHAWSPYDHSQILVGILYEILLELFARNRTSAQNDAENLYQSGQQWMKDCVKVFRNCLVPNPSISDFGNHLVEVFGNGPFEMKHLLKRRNIC